MRSAAAGLLLSLVPARCCPCFAGADQAGVQTGQTAQAAAEASPEGCWAGQEGGGTAVYCFRGSQILASSPAAVWSHDRLAVRDGVLSVLPEPFDLHFVQAPPLPGGRA